MKAERFEDIGVLLVCGAFLALVIGLPPVHYVLLATGVPVLLYGIARA